MNLSELFLKENVDEEVFNFIKEYINTFEKLDIIKYFGRNLSSRVDEETLIENTNDKREDLIKSLDELVRKHIIEETILQDKKFYELSKDKKIMEIVKRFTSYYDKTAIRLTIIGYILDNIGKK